MEDITGSSQLDPKPTLRLNDIGGLVQSQEKEIVNWVVSQLNSQDRNDSQYNQPLAQGPRMTPATIAQSRNLTSDPITKLENLLAQVRGEQELEQ